MLVTDNLKTHGIAALYEAFEPVLAHRLARRFEWHYRNPCIRLVHARAWFVAQHCGDRIVRTLKAMPESPDSGPGNPTQGSRRVAAEAKRGSGESRLAVHQRQSPNQTEEALPDDSAAMNH